MSEIIIIADTSCLIGLKNIGQLNLLRSVFGKIVITPEVSVEYEEAIPEWFQIQAVADAKKQEILELELDKGEASSIALALEMHLAMLIIDEKKGRTIAKGLGIPILGTLGILLKAKEMGLLPLIRTEIEKLENKGFRISDMLKKKILERANE